MKTSKLADVFNSIEEQTDFYFFYNRDQLDDQRIVSVDVENKKVEEVLDDLFRGQDIAYKIDGRNILIEVKGTNLIRSAQQKTVSGKVTDSSGAALPGVTVVVKGTTQGIITDFDGNYSLPNVPSDAMLVFSFVGMKTQEISVTGKSNINVMLEEEMVGIEEVVAIGYGTMKKSDLTGSIGSVKNDVLGAFPSTNVAQALQGRISGVQVIQNNGKPGGNITIQIRGANSIRGDNGPLWIIDGFPGDFSILNMADIERLEVLKDASATAIYGSRGANGVILVTTKRGKPGSTVVEYDGSYSMQSLRKKLDLMNAKEYMTFNNIQQLNDVGKEYFTQEQINNAGEGTDWQDLMFRVAPINDHSLTVSGGNEKTKFSIGGSYFDQAGIIVNDDGYRRISLKANIDHDISKKVKISYNALLSRIDKNTMNETGDAANSIITATIDAPPTLTPYNEDGSYRVLKTAYPFSYDGLPNPLNYANEVSTKYYANKVMTSLSMMYLPINDLSIKVAGNLSNTDYRSDSYVATTFLGSSGEAGISTYNSVQLNCESIINYNKKISENHSVSLTGALTYDKYRYISLGASGTGFLSDIYETYNIGSANTFGTPSSSYSEWTLLSYLGRLNYSYKGKYLATASFRADGSSRYSEGNKWGYFPSGALAWRISDEPFLKDNKTISNLKLRGGYGETGSTAISPYTTLSILGTGKAVFGNHQLFTMFTPSSVYPGNLKWETTAQSNLGIDMGFLNNRLNITIDYYIKNTRDLLNSVQLPRSSGYSSTIKNIGKVQNKGFEFQFDANILDKGIKWDVSANLSLNRNKVIKLYNGQDITGSNPGITILSDYVNLAREGEPMGIFFGYKEDGYDASGKIKYLDINADKSITAADKTIIGNPNPDFIYSFNSILSYKNFELSWYIQGSQGNDVYSLSLAKNYYYGIGVNMFKEVLDDHWTLESPDAKYPRISKSSATLKLSDRFVYDGSYIRLKNIQLAYNIPVNKIGTGWIKSGQVYVSCQNLLTISKYPFWDPEVNSVGERSSISQGIDYFTYPTTKGLTFGFKLRF